MSGARSFGPTALRFLAAWRPSWCAMRAVHVECARASRERAAWDDFQTGIAHQRQGSAQRAARGRRRRCGWQPHAGVGLCGLGRSAIAVGGRDFLTDRATSRDRLTAVAAVYEQFSTEATDDPRCEAGPSLAARVSEMEGKLDDARAAVCGWSRA